MTKSTAKIVKIVVTVLLISVNQASVFSQAVSDCNYPAMPASIMRHVFTDTAGNAFTLADHAGKVILVNLWGIWCGPCRPQIPELVRLQTKFGDRGFVVIGLNIGDMDQKPEKLSRLKSFAEKLQINYLLARSPKGLTNELFALVKEDVVPESILIDRKGRIRGVYVGGGPSVDNVMIDTVKKAIDECREDPTKIMFSE